MNTPTYRVATLGCSSGSSNVQFVILNGTTGVALTPAEIEALNLTENEIIVMNAGNQVALSKTGTGTCYKELGGSAVALKWDFAAAGSAIKVFDIYAYDGLTVTPNATTKFGAAAGYVKAHLGSALGATGTSLAVYIDRAGFTTMDGTVG